MCLLIEVDVELWHAENCNGGISARNLEKLAIAHDFIWTDKEVADMIHLFDTDGDAKVSTYRS